MVPLFEFVSDVWVWGETGSWRFATVPKDISDDIKALTGNRRTGFGAVKVRATIGGSVWESSLFPSKNLGAYVLPVKSAVRKAEGIADGAQVSIQIALIGL